ncbi:hypothetical protein COW36_16315 [bacterium (Candidatus Blackallbacteria) CG17_big_fil_post_rev_8_21_14_2_50_48_46]|uniref:Uncharacterized protein n=1 Tax=bacterium (Candidatus Blackallbacteria) CG17_big_fil_post_rev_8_21_14_2_50_48_46 TaxID=2014261 RepID=A0A2M7G2S4_9BACT|nr:MAG: hypothetical protein COW64_16785 [bacterium (Candidatus Blackallbacteria) CG18_big_fil_WC_8_21_14_2_50_49_26]PIW15700.1 MAG: hypothetical protein COW36_16315 [bacterium (Candidatus Blackallbacteria) CG17_big_fil_post_rev_8_21_14_2_50_48_46]PIW48705.1 MAG: hypothetical protein COW20_08495 [bacterium (Candidatus Blackallbacteria) CG13_big_fil_rev_8_21_14_2_50_49_14]
MVLSSTRPLILDYLPENLRWHWEEHHEMRKLASQQQDHFLFFSDLEVAEQILALEEFFQLGFSRVGTELGSSFLGLKSEKGYYILFLEQTGNQEVQHALEQLLEALQGKFPFSQDPELESLISALLVRVQSMKHRSRLARLVNHHLQAVQPESGLFQDQEGEFLPLHVNQNPLEPAFWEDELQRMEVWVKQLQQTQFQEAYHSARARWKEARRILEERKNDTLRLRDTERVSLLFVQVGELVRRYFWQNEQLQNSTKVAADWICQVITQAVNAAAETSQEARLLRMSKGLKAALLELNELGLGKILSDCSDGDNLLCILKALAQGEYPLPDLVGVLSKALSLAVAERSAAAQEQQPLEKGSLEECLQASIFLELSHFTQGDIDMLALHRASALLSRILYKRFFEPIPLAQG